MIEAHLTHTQLAEIVKHKDEPLKRAYNRLAQWAHKGHPAYNGRRWSVKRYNMWIDGKLQWCQKNQRPLPEPSTKPEIKLVKDVETFF